MQFGCVYFATLNRLLCDPLLIKRSILSNFKHMQMCINKDKTTKRGKTFRSLYNSLARDILAMQSPRIDLASISVINERYFMNLKSL